MSTEIHKIDRLVSASGFAYWEVPEFLQREAPELLPVAEEVRALKALIEALNGKLDAMGFGHRFSLQVDYREPPKPWPDDALTVAEAIAFLGEFPSEQMLSSGFEHPHSYRGKYECLAIEPTATPMSVWALWALLQESEGMYSGWGGGEFYMGSDTHVYVSEQGTSMGAVTLSKTLLRKLLGVA